MRWAALPPGRRARWLIPRRPAAARAGLAVYQPMTPWGRAGWESARLIARVGAFYLVPTQGASELTRAVQPYIASGGSVAVSFAHGGRRGVALVLDAMDRPTHAVKVALDEDGRQRLAREADRLDRLGRLLQPPLAAPRVIESGDGVLALEPVAWLPRSRPWFLPEQLARGIGRFHAAVEGEGGVAARAGHGDFAPWNVMATRQGWTLLDWEEARLASAPYDDPFHYLVQAHALLGRPRAAQILEGLQRRGWVGRAIGAYAAAARLPGVEPRDALVDYLRRSMPADDSTRPDHVRGRMARRALLSRLEQNRR